MAVGLLRLAIRYVGDPDSTGSLTGWQLTVARIAGIHAVIALTYAVWPKKAPPHEPADRAERPRH